MAANTNAKKTSDESSAERQALIMWALLATEKAGAFQKDLKPKPSPNDREALETAGLITWKKNGKIWIEVTAKGWAWANENLGRALPIKSTAGAAVLDAWLVKLDTLLNARGLKLADVFGPQPTAQLSANGHAGKRPIGAAPKSLRDRIRAAYLDTTGNRFSTRALLKDIRARLADVDRSMLDEELKTMQSERQAALYPLDNRIEITESDRAAAISFAGEPRHILWIER